jgi:UDP-glucose 4-epimerase
LAQVTITGVAGFLGSHLADLFISKGWKVKGIDSLIGGYLSNVPAEVDFYQHDLTWDIELMEEGFIGSDLVIHAACTAYEGLSVFSPSLVVKNTVQATTNALTASQRQGVQKFIYLSSMARYGTLPTPYTEEMIVAPQDPYGIAKVASELLVKNVCDTHGMDWVILVPHNIIGPRQKYDDPFRNVASIMSNLLLQNKPPIIYGDGTQMRCFSFIDDVIEPLYIACFDDSVVGEVINIGPDEEAITINELAEKLQKIIGTNFEPIYTGGRPQEVKIALCSSDKARKLLNYKTSTTLEKGLTDLVEWVKNKGTKKFEYHLPIEIVSDRLPDTWSKRLF